MNQPGRRSLDDYIKLSIMLQYTINNRSLYVVLRIIFSIIGNHFRIIGKI